MGGSIDFDSTLGKGSKFKISLTLDIDRKSISLKPEALDTGKGGADSSKQSSTGISPPIVTDEILEQLRTMNVMIVDDQDMVLKSTADILSRLGLNFTCASSGEEALIVLEEELNFTVLLLDIHMGGMSGIEVTRHVRSMKSIDPIIIAVTADNTKSNIKDCYDAGVDGFINKPLSTNSLVSKLCELAGIDDLQQCLIEDSSPHDAPWTPELALEEISSFALAALTTASVVNTYKHLEEDVRKLLPENNEKAYATLHAFKNLIGLIRAFQIHNTVSNLEELDLDTMDRYFSSLRSQMEGLSKSFSEWMTKITNDNEKGDAQSIYDNLIGNEASKDELQPIRDKWGDSFIGELLDKTLQHPNSSGLIDTNKLKTVLLVIFN